MLKKNHKILIALVLLFIFLSNGHIYSQEIFSGPDGTVDIFWDFYSNNRMSTVSAGRGYTGLSFDNDISGVVLNPASLKIDKKFQAHVEYVYKTDIAWPPNISHNPSLKQLHPAFLVSAAYRPNDYFQTGLLFSVSNSMRYIYTITDEFGNQLNDDIHMDLRISSISMPLVYNYKDKLRAGVSLMYTFYRGFVNHVSTISNPDGNLEAETSFNKFNVQLGLLVIPLKGFSLGFTFTPQVQQSVVTEFSDGSTGTFTESNFYPIKVSIGSAYKFSNMPLTIGFDYNYLNTSKQDGLYDRNDFNIGFEYSLHKNFTLRTGFFTVNKYSNSPDSEDRYYLTLGGTLKLGNIYASIAILDSHFQVDAETKQTIINGGLTMDF